MQHLPDDAWQIVVEALGSESIQLLLVAVSFHADLAWYVLEIYGFRVSMLVPKMQTLDLCIQSVKNMTGGEEDARQLLKSMPLEYRQSREVLLPLIQIWTPLLSELGPLLSPYWQEDRDLALSLLTYWEPYYFGDPDVLSFFKKFSGDPEVVEAAVRQQGTSALEWAEGFQSDRQIALLALEREPSYPNHIASVLWQDPTFLPEAVRRNCSVFLHVADHLSYELALEAVTLYPRQMLLVLPSDFRQDPKIIRRALDSDPLSAAYIPDELCTFAVMKASVSRNPFVFSMVPKWLQNKELALLALGLDGLMLRFGAMQKYWSQDEDVVLVAVKQNGLALEYASMHLRFNQTVLKAALRQNGLALAFAGKSARYDHELVRIAAQQNPCARAFGHVD